MIFVCLLNRNFKPNQIVKSGLNQKVKYLVWFEKISNGFKRFGLKICYKQFKLNRVHPKSNLLFYINKTKKK